MPQIRVVSSDSNITDNIIRTKNGALRNSNINWIFLWGLPILNPLKLSNTKKRKLPNPVKCIGYIKCYSLSRPIPVKSPSNSIRYNCNKICSGPRRPKTILEIRKRPHFSRWSIVLLFTGFSKTLLTTKKSLTGR